ncbi:ommochrome-binding protein-like [Cydia fagiglandana]|uniref:ommochrome-binding protein-like n=1 Tax=Cydia fagiglandana TaxID=1458189 RepID=UPI002FEE5BAA
MHFLLLLSISGVASGEFIKCDGVIFRGVYFDKVPFVRNFYKPSNLFLHKFSGMLFFSNTVLNGTNITDFTITSCSVDSGRCTDVHGIPGGFAIGYDQGNDDVYLGGHDGIYKYNFVSRAAEFFGEEGRSIWSLFIRKNFYYIRYPEQKLYVYVDSAFVKVAEAYYFEVDIFFISRQNDIYIANKTALYKIEHPSYTSIFLADNFVVRQIVEDGFGDIYFCGNDGIYIEDKPAYGVKRVAKIDDAYGLVFDENDQVMFSDRDTIYRLKQSPYSNECFYALSSYDQTGANK